MRFQESSITTRKISLIIDYRDSRTEICCPPKLRLYKSKLEDLPWRDYPTKVMTICFSIEDVNDFFKTKLFMQANFKTSTIGVKKVSMV